VHGGLQSLKGTTASTNAGITRNILAVVAPTKKYTATAYAQVTDGTTPLKFQTIQKCNGAAADTYPTVQWVATPTINTWITLTGTVDLSACTTIEKLELLVGKDVGDVYVDDVSLELQP